MVVETQEREEPVGRQSDEPIGQPEPEMEQVFPQGLSPQQPERQPEPPLNDDEQRTPRDRKEQELEHETCQQWLRWLGEQVSNVADQMDEEQRQWGHQEERLRMTTEELEKVRAHMWGLEEELTKAREYAAIMTNMGQNTRMDTDPVAEAVVQKANPEPQPKPEPATATLETGTEQAQELVALREELAA